MEEKLKLYENMIYLSMYQNCAINSVKDSINVLVEDIESLSKATYSKEVEYMICDKACELMMEVDQLPLYINTVPELKSTVDVSMYKLFKDTFPILDLEVKTSAELAAGATGTVAGKKLFESIDYLFEETISDIDEKEIQPLLDAEKERISTLLDKICKTLYSIYNKKILKYNAYDSKYEKTFKNINTLLSSKMKALVEFDNYVKKNLNFEYMKEKKNKVEFIKEFYKAIHDFQVIIMAIYIFKVVAANIEDFDKDLGDHSTGSINRSNLSYLAALSKPILPNMEPAKDEINEKHGFKLITSWSDDIKDTWFCWDDLNGVYSDFFKSVDPKVQKALEYIVGEPNSSYDELYNRKESGFIAKQSKLSVKCLHNNEQVMRDFISIGQEFLNLLDTIALEPTNSSINMEKMKFLRDKFRSVMENTKSAMYNLKSMSNHRDSMLTLRDR